MWNDTRPIIHLDMDAYFASIEQKCNPSLKGKPIIVTGDGRRTVVATASYEARSYGVKTGMTLSEAKKLCPQLIRVVAEPEKYLYTTVKIHDILLNFTDQIETYSIDEFFLDVTDSQLIFGSPEQIAEKIKSKVEKDIGLSCSLGLAPNKLLAKLASSMHKPSGLTIIYPKDVKNLLEDLPVEELHGIGEKIKEHLNQLGIKTAGQLAEAPMHLLLSHFGFCGHLLKFMGQGRDFSSVPRYWEQDLIKSIGHSYTLPFDTLDEELIRSYLLMLCERVATRLRRGGKMGRTVVLTIRYKDFHTFTHQKTVPYPLYQGKRIYEICLKILRSTGKLKKSIRLIGVSVTQLMNHPEQLYLFDEFKKEERLVQAIDEIAERYGEFIIKPASLLIVEKVESLPAAAPLKKNLAYLKS